MTPHLELIRAEDEVHKQLATATVPGLAVAILQQFVDVIDRLVPDCRERTLAQEALTLASWKTSELLSTIRRAELARRVIPPVELQLRSAEIHALIETARMWACHGADQ